MYFFPVMEMFVQICFGLSILFLFVLLVVFIYLNSCF